MHRFKNILVGVDLSRRDRLVANELNRHSSRAYRSALDLAKRSDAHLHFFYALDISLDAQEKLQRDRELSPTLVDTAEDRMKGLVEEAGGQGIRATGSVVFGKSWLAITQEVLKGRHDLVMVGTRQLSAVKSVLLGSIGVQLLRKCPCPVWVSKAPANGNLASILLANDQTALGERAMEIAVSLAQLHSSELHVLHSLAGYAGASRLPAQLSPEEVHLAEQRTKTQLMEAGLDRAARVRFTQASSFCDAISDYVEQNGNDLLILGTQACGGLSRMIKRDRSERLLSRVPCSLLALKPVVASVSLDEPEDRSASIGAA